MSDEKKAAQATPNATLEQQVMSACIAKSEREWWAKHRIDALAAELATVKAELIKWQRIRTPTHGTCCTCQQCGLDYDSCRCALDDMADDLTQCQQQRDHWKQEAVWAANEFMKERECFFQVSYMGQWEMEIAKDPDYQRAQAILKEAEI